MPVDTDSDEWNAESPEGSARTDILEFLESNPNQAYSIDDVAEQVFDTDLYLDIPEETGPIEEILGRSFASLKDKSSLRAILRIHLSSLVYEGEAEVRNIPNEKLDNNIDEGVTSFYTSAN